MSFCSYFNSRENTQIAAKVVFGIVAFCRMLVIENKMCFVNSSFTATRHYIMVYEKQNNLLFILFYVMHIRIFIRSLRWTTVCFLRRIDLSSRNSSFTGKHKRAPLYYVYGKQCFMESIYHVKILQI